MRLPIRFSYFWGSPAYAGSKNEISLNWGWTACPIDYKSRYMLKLNLKINFRDYGIAAYYERKYENILKS